MSCHDYTHYTEDRAERFIDMPTANVEKRATKKTDRQYTRGPRRVKDTNKEMLKPENPIDVAEPGSSGETVNQRRLRAHYELQEEYYDLRDRYHASLVKIQDLLVKGADVQTGQYKVSSGVRLVRRPRYKQVVIDLKGEAYQQRVLESTRPHAHFVVRIQ